MKRQRSEYNQPLPLPKKKRFIDYNTPEQTITPLRLMDKLRLADLASQYIHNANKVDKQTTRDHSPSQWAVVLYQPTLYKQLREKYEIDNQNTCMEVQV